MNVMVFNKGEREIVLKTMTIKPKDHVSIPKDEAENLVKLFDGEVFIIGENTAKVGDDVVEVPKKSRGRKTSDPEIQPEAPVDFGENEAI